MRKSSFAALVAVLCPCFFAVTMAAQDIGYTPVPPLTIVGWPVFSGNGPAQSALAVVALEGLGSNSRLTVTAGNSVLADALVSDQVVANHPGRSIFHLPFSAKLTGGNGQPLSVPPTTPIVATLTYSYGLTWKVTSQGFVGIGTQSPDRKTLTFPGTFSAAPAAVTFDLSTVTIGTKEAKTVSVFPDRVEVNVGGFASGAPETAGLYVVTITQVTVQGANPQEATASSFLLFFQPPPPFMLLGVQ